MFLSDVFVVVDPGDHRLKHLLLSGDGELVAGDQAGNLLHAQVEELLAADHFRKVLL